MAELRIARGECPSCQQQLYKFKETEDLCCLQQIFGKVQEDGQGKQKIPLTIPMLVERGQCLRCSQSTLPLKPLEKNSSDTVSATDSSSVGSRAPSAVSDDDMAMIKAMDRGDSTRVPGAVARCSPRNSKASLTIDAAALKNEERNGMMIPSLTPASINTSLPNGTAVYTGDYNLLGEKHGEGEMVWSNGDTYTGAFFKDCRQGHGVLTFSSRDPSQTDGGEYVGDWKANQMHGSGTRRYPNSDVYMGEYVNGKRDGEGRFYYANGDLYWGDWKENQMHGNGRYYYLSGQRFEGTFTSSKRNGKGKLQRVDGTLEIFQYVNDQRVGQGVRWSEDRTKAWRLWAPKTSTGQANFGSQMEKQSISIAEAVSLDYEIEQAALCYAKDAGSSLS